MTAELVKTTGIAESDSYAIYQVKAGEDYQLLRFSSLGTIGIDAVNRKNYDMVYSAALDDRLGKDTDEILNSLFERFNMHHPADYTGRSMSVSDVIALNLGGKVSCFYVEPIGFQEISGFLDDQNHLRNAEMAMEDDYDMIDGIINNGEKKSILAELRELASQHQNEAEPRKAYKENEKEIGG